MRLDQLTMDRLKNNPSGYFFLHHKFDHILYVYLNDRNRPEWMVADSGYEDEIGTYKEYILNTERSNYQIEYWQQNYSLIDRFEDIIKKKKSLVNAII